MTDPLQSRSDCVSMRDRMMVRLALDGSSPAAASTGGSGSLPPASSAPQLAAAVAALPIVTLEPVASATSSQHHPSQPSSTTGPTPHPHNPQPATAAASSTVLTSSERCRSLKERIYERSTLPLRAHEVVRDVYAQDQPFPVNSVFEVDRVQLPPDEATRQHGQLLMATEAAQLVRSLEGRLSTVLQYNTDLSNANTKLTTDVNSVKTALVAKEREGAEMKARADELTRQIDQSRRECQAAIDQSKVQVQQQINAAVAAADAKWDAQVRELQATNKGLKDDLVGAESDKKLLEAVIMEIKEQLSQNTVALQTHAQTIRQMTNELVHAKHQATTVSLGLQTKDKQLRDAQQTLRLLQGEVNDLKPVVAQLKEERDARIKFEAQVGEMKKQVANYPALEAERAKLLQHVTKLEAELPEKNRELMALKSQLDALRSQAAAAYEHTQQFGAAGRSGGAMNYGDSTMRHDALYSGAGPASGAAGTTSASAAALRREVEEEERRANDDMRRWRAKMTSGAGK